MSAREAARQGASDLFRPICRHYTQGTCNRGARCSFSHASAPLVPPRPAPRHRSKLQAVASAPPGELRADPMDVAVDPLGMGSCSGARRPLPHDDEFVGVDSPHTCKVLRHLGSILGGGTDKAYFELQAPRACGAASGAASSSALPVPEGARSWTLRLATPVSGRISAEDRVSWERVPIGVGGTCFPSGVALQEGLEQLLAQTPAGGLPDDQELLCDLFAHHPLHRHLLDRHARIKVDEHPRENQAKAFFLVDAAGQSTFACHLQCIRKLLTDVLGALGNSERVLVVATIRCDEKGVLEVQCGSTAADRHIYEQSRGLEGKPDNMLVGVTMDFERERLCLLSRDDHGQPRFLGEWKLPGFRHKVLFPTLDIDENCKARAIFTEPFDLWASADGERVAAQKVPAQAAAIASEAGVAAPQAEAVLSSPCRDPQAWPLPQRPQPRPGGGGGPAQRPTSHGADQEADDHTGGLGAAPGAAALEKVVPTEGALEATGSHQQCARPQEGKAGGVAETSPKEIFEGATEDCQESTTASTAAPTSTVTGEPDAEIEPAPGDPGADGESASIARLRMATSAAEVAEAVTLLFQEADRRRVLVSTDRQWEVLSFLKDHWTKILLGPDNDVQRRMICKEVTLPYALGSAAPHELKCPYVLGHAAGGLMRNQSVSEPPGGPSRVERLYWELLFLRLGCDSFCVPATAALDLLLTAGPHVPQTVEPGTEKVTVLALRAVLEAYEERGKLPLLRDQCRVRDMGGAERCPADGLFGPEWARILGPDFVVDVAPAFSELGRKLLGLNLELSVALVIGRMPRIVAASQTRKKDFVTPALEYLAKEWDEGRLTGDLSRLKSALPIPSSSTAECSWSMLASSKSVWHGHLSKLFPASLEKFFVRALGVRPGDSLTERYFAHRPSGPVPVAAHTRHPQPLLQGAGAACGAPGLPPGLLTPGPTWGPGRGVEAWNPCGGQSGRGEYPVGPCARSGPLGPGPLDAATLTAAAARGGLRAEPPGLVQRSASASVARQNRIPVAWAPGVVAPAAPPAQPAPHPSQQAMWAHRDPDVQRRALDAMAKARLGSSLARFDGPLADLVEKGKRTAEGVRKPASLEESACATVKFNVSGRHFEVSRERLAMTPESTLTQLARDAPGDDPIFFEGNPDLFVYVLEYLKHQHVNLPITVSRRNVLEELRRIGLDARSEAVRQEVPPGVHASRVHAEQPWTVLGEDGGATWQERGGANREHTDDTDPENGGDSGDDTDGSDNSLAYLCGDLTAELAREEGRGSAPSRVDRGLRSVLDAAAEDASLQKVCDDQACDVTPPLPQEARLARVGAFGREDLPLPQDVDASSHLSRHAQLLARIADPASLEAEVAAARERPRLVPVGQIWFTKERVEEKFDHGPFAGQAIQDVVEAVVRDEVRVEQLPLILVRSEGRLWTLNNRTLFVLRKAGQSKGCLQATALVRKPCPFTAAFLQQRLGGPR